MPRTLRIRLAGVPNHVTHRGNQRRQIFFDERDYRHYLTLLANYARMFSMHVWAYCLMPNHVHLLVVGEHPDSISRAIGNTQRVFARRCHRDARVTGHFWGTRHYAAPLDEPHVWAAVRYIERNPVRACLVTQATTYPWSSAAAHAGLRHDPLLDSARPFPGPVGDWAAWLSIDIEAATVDTLRRNTTLGRPTGSETFVTELERRTGRRLRRRKPGPPPRSGTDPRHRNPC